VTDPSAAAQLRHSQLENLQALITGVMLISFGVVLMAAAGLVTGGAPGIAFLLHYATGWPLGGLFMAVNVPFYLFALRVFGVRFTLTSVLAAALVSLLIQLVPGWLVITQVQRAYAAVFGGLAIGAGLLMLFRHQTSLGGLNVLVLWLQRRLGWPTGRVQMVLDCTIVLGAWFVTDTERVAYSVLGAVALNLVLAFNHKPGRYLGL
jgi:uncharacterized membrane-anchored protein YitT (DUF2179 family)